MYTGRAERMKIIRAILIVVASAILGAFLALRWQHASSTPLYQKHSDRQVREQFVPAQELVVYDAKHRIIASINVGGGGFNFASFFWNPKELLTLSFYQSGRISILARDFSLITDGNSNESAFVVGGGQGTQPIFGEWPQHERRLFHSIGDLISHRKPSWKVFDDVIPTEDLRLRNREGWVFATLGLNEAGCPGIAFADGAGVVRGVWFQRCPPGPEYWDFAVFDKGGKTRVSLELHPDQPPNLVFFGEMGEYLVADMRSGKLVEEKDHQRGGPLSWLGPMTVRPVGPIRVVDLRGRQLWIAP
jgi:hypothetical protein